METVFEILIEILFSYPGAGIRWLWHRGNIPYSKLLEDDFEYNSFPAFVLIVVFLVIGSIIF